MKIKINENQFKFLTEGYTPGDVSYEMRTSIALWCLTNDFRFYMPNNVFGSKTSVANSEPINKEICLDIMKAYEISDANEEKELFGYNDYDDFEDGDDERDEYMNGFKIYKIRTEKEEYYIEVADNISEYDGEMLLQDYADGENENELIGWFYKIFR